MNLLARSSLRLPPRPRGSRVYSMLDTGHDFWPEPHPDIPPGLDGETLSGWECPVCKLFVMTVVGTTPENAPRVYLTFGSFTPDLWHHWTCAVYQAKVS